jgi:RNA polymerase sigma-70 factor (sigma-E family)
VEASFEDFVLTQGDALVRFAVMLCGDRGRAEDLVQTALLKAYPQWDRVALMTAPVAYVRTIVVREQLRWWRRRSSGEVATASTGADLADPSDPAQAHADRDAAWTLLARLPRRQRAVLVLRFYEDLSDAAIATILQCRESTVRSQAARGLAALRAVAADTDREALP